MQAVFLTSQVILRKAVRTPRGISSSVGAHPQGSRSLKTPPKRIGIQRIQFAYVLALLIAWCGTQSADLPITLSLDFMLGSLFVVGASLEVYSNWNLLTRTPQATETASEASRWIGILVTGALGCLALGGTAVVAAKLAVHQGRVGSEKAVFDYFYDDYQLYLKIFLSFLFGSAGVHNMITKIFPQKSIRSATPPRPMNFSSVLGGAIGGAFFGLAMAGMASTTPSLPYVLLKMTTAAILMIIGSRWIATGVISTKARGRHLALGLTALSASAAMWLPGFDHWVGAGPSSYMAMVPILRAA